MTAQLGFAAEETPAGTDEFNADEEASIDGLTRASKVVFSASLGEPLTGANATLVRDDAVAVVRAMKESGSGLMSRSAASVFAGRCWEPDSSIASVSSCSR